MCFVPSVTFQYEYVSSFLLTQSMWALILIADFIYRVTEKSPLAFKPFFKHL